jgi:hypothetical protein
LATLAELSETPACILAETSFPLLNPDLAGLGRGTSGFFCEPPFPFETPTPTTAFDGLGRGTSSFCEPHTRFETAAPAPAFDGLGRGTSVFHEPHSLFGTSTPALAVDGLGRGTPVFHEPRLRSGDFAGEGFFVWAFDRLPGPLDLNAVIPATRLHAEGKQVSIAPTRLSPVQMQRLGKNRMYNTVPRTDTQRVSYLLDRYTHMDPDVIRLATKLLPDSGNSIQKGRHQSKDILTNASMFDRCDIGKVQSPRPSNNSPNPNCPVMLYTKPMDPEADARLGTSLS